ncbi:MAG: prolipoprotein diacylglyceryl transferase [Thermodesulfobacteriota bacterium]
MFPILFRLGPLNIYSYGFFVILGFTIAAIFAIRRAKIEGISILYERLIDLFFYSILSAIIGARALYVAINFRTYLKKPWAIFNLPEGGLVFYGGLILAIGVSFVYMRRYQLPLWKLVDFVAPYVSLGLSFGKIGCFFAGCCYGKETSLPWAIVFRNPNSLARLNVPLHPVQLYESALNLIIFFLLLRRSKRKTFEGEIFWLFILLYSTVRFFTEMMRGDPRGYLFNSFLTTSQGIGLFLAFLSFFMLFYFKKIKGRKKTDGSLRNS